MDNQFQLNIRSTKRKFSQPAMRSTMSSQGTRVFSIDSSGNPNFNNNDQACQNSPFKLKSDRNLPHFTSALNTLNRTQTMTLESGDKSPSVSNPKSFKRIISFRDAENLRTQDNNSQQSLGESSPTKTVRFLDEENSLNNDPEPQPTRRRARIKTLKLNVKPCNLYDIKEDDSLEHENIFLNQTIKEKNEENYIRDLSEVWTHKHYRCRVREFSISPEDESRKFQEKSPKFAKGAKLKEMIGEKNISDIRIRVRGSVISSRLSADKVDQDNKIEKTEKRNSLDSISKERKIQFSRKIHPKRWTWKGANGVIFS
ncbi:unnamed protein product [Blepharisma stoltei]|uniref:Uncharacterized protein n=1 Tax=Blepharisma stoltei TaxID=1481888 RepID=A0AAU9IU44_9CILI|nr:unnamed protein product [Blepharisma stoltei]